MSVFLSATPNNSTRKSRLGPLTSFFAERESFLPVHVTLQQPNQYATHFPELVREFGSRAFDSYWS
jgi:hypothetical protein